MRLICPNCDAEYEVDDGMIPAQGRDVQCSNCETTWFQSSPAQPEPEPIEDEPDPDEDETLPQFKHGVGMAAITKATEAQSGVRRRITPEALAVIEQEVDFETKAREDDVGADSAKQDTSSSSSEVDETANRVREMTEQDAKEREGTLAAAPKRDEAAEKGGIFPDIDELNSKLEANSAAEEEEEAEERNASPRMQAIRRARAYRTGFGLMLILSAFALVLYGYAPNIAARLPGWTEEIARYVATVDVGRVQLDAGTKWVVEQINVLIGQIS